MNIRMLALQAGPDGVRELGKVYDVPEKEAKELINGGYAEAVKAKTETASQPEPTAEKKADNKNKGKAKKDADASSEPTADTSSEEAKG